MKKINKQKAHGAPAPQALIDALAEMIQADGEATVVQRLALGRQTVARALAGLPVHRATLAVLRQHLTV